MFVKDTTRDGVRRRRRPTDEGHVALSCKVKPSIWSVSVEWSKVPSFWRDALWFSSSQAAGSILPAIFNIVLCEHEHRPSERTTNQPMTHPLIVIYILITSTEMFHFFMRNFTGGMGDWCKGRRYCILHSG